MKKNLTGSESTVTASIAPQLTIKLKQLAKLVESEKKTQICITEKNADVRKEKGLISEKKKKVKDAEACLKSAEKELNSQLKKVDTLTKSVAKLQSNLANTRMAKAEALEDITKISNIKTINQALKAYNELLEKEAAEKEAKAANKTKKKAEKVEIDTEAVVKPTFDSEFIEKTNEKVEEITTEKKEETVTEVKETIEKAEETIEKAEEKVKKTAKKKKSTTKKRTDTKIVTPPTVRPEIIVEDKTIDIEKAEVTALDGKKKIEIVYSFDTTGSMYTVLSLVRKHIVDSIKQMFSLDCELKVGVIAHGDYCDKDHPYTIMAMDLTDKDSDLQKFVQDIEPTYGGDADECYELVLKTINENISWSEDSTKMVVLIGDANPHGVSYRDNIEKIDWKSEVKKLADKDISIYAVHALSNYRKSSKAFYEHMASETGGVYLTLDNFSDVNDLMIASLYQKFSEDKLNQYVTIIRDNGRLTRTLADNVNRLAKKDITKSTFDSIEGLNIVPAGRFQVIPVDEKCDIKGFVQNNGIMYKVGRAFYELTKTEDVQQYKEVILQDKESGDMYFGEDTRKYLGLLPQVIRSGKYAHEKIKPVKGDKYRVFVQSTSVNRKLVPGTNLLYEISESESR